MKTVCVSAQKQKHPQARRRFNLTCGCTVNGLLSCLNVGNYLLHERTFTLIHSPKDEETSLCSTQLSSNPHSTRLYFTVGCRPYKTAYWYIRKKRKILSCDHTQNYPMRQQAGFSLDVFLSEIGP